MMSSNQRQSFYSQYPSSHNVQQSVIPSQGHWPRTSTYQLIQGSHNRQPTIPAGNCLNAAKIGLNVKLSFRSFEKTVDSFILI